MKVMQTGFDSAEKPILRVLSYVSFQELATRVSHRNTGRFAGDPVAEKLLTRVSTDENLHMVFYRNLTQAALEIAPNATMRAITDEVVGFAMPGVIIPGFTRKAVQIAQAGIYDLRVHHDEVIWPLLRHWKVFELEGLDAEGEKARTELSEFLARIDAQAVRFEEQRSRARERAAAAGEAG
jgi:acyl-[acyl-carrier-protein] desaturase